MILGSYVVAGQVRSGKNHMQIARNGRHYPLPAWAAWRDRVVWELLAQRRGAPMIAVPCRIFVDYVAGDQRRRDVAGMLDALGHCFERAGIIKDDFLLREIGRWTHRLDPASPRADIYLHSLE